MKLSDVLDKLNDIRQGAVSHNGVNPVVWMARHGLYPKSYKELGSLYGLLGMLANPDLEQSDLRALAQDIVIGTDPALSRFFQS